MNRISKNMRIKGVTLIEVLVAIVITSIGILGFASLQFLGLNSNQSAYYRSQASFIASDLSERMRANIDGMNANAYAAFNSTTIIACDNSTIPANFCDERFNGSSTVAAQACDESQRAVHDLFVATCGYSSNEYANPAEKTSLLTDLLPNGNIQVTCNDSVPTPAVDADTCTDFSDHTIVVSWFELDEEAAADGKLSYNDDPTAGSSAVKSVTYRVRL